VNISLEDDSDWMINLVVVVVVLNQLIRLFSLLTLHIYQVKYVEMFIFTLALHMYCI
jgi:hypothetical protein